MFAMAKRYGALSVLFAVLLLPGLAARWGVGTPGPDAAGRRVSARPATERASRVTQASQVAPGASVVPAGGIAARTPGEPGSIVSSVRTRERVLALTFDDGPSADLPLVLDVLSRTHSAATFFVVGKRCVGKEAMLVDIVAAGSEVGNHTEYHLEVDEGCPDRELRLTIATAQERIGGAVGREARFFRPPAGRFDARLPNVTRRMGLVTVLWDVHSWDTNAKTTADGLVASVASRVRPGSIVLLHETAPATVEALPALIARLKADGYRLVTLSELMSSGEPR